MASIEFFAVALFLALGVGGLRSLSLRGTRTPAALPPARRVRPAAPTLETQGGHGLAGAAQHA